jgi:hypothetical protein
MISRDAAFPAVILAVLLLGAAWTRWAGRKFDKEDVCGDFLMFGLAVLHGLLQFLPWLAYAVGWLHPATGLPWEAHLAYATALALAAPWLSQQTDREVREQTEVPVLGWLLGLEPAGGGDSYRYSRQGGWIQQCPVLS